MSTTTKSTESRFGRRRKLSPNELFLYFDPVHRLSKEAQARWQDAEARRGLVRTAINAVNADLTAEQREKIAQRLEGIAK